jgi:hypothetical protein
LKENKENIVAGLVFGLVAGLVFGLEFGLVAGLAAGLAVGLAVGLVAGLGFGLAVGLANLFQLIPKEFLWIFLLVAGIIILSEFLFYGKGYESGSKFWFTCKRKLEAILESSIIIINGLNIRWLIVKYDLFNKIPYKIVLKWIGYIGVGIIILALIIGLFYLWIKINEFRVKK